MPAAPRWTAHFHLNVLTDARSVASTRALTDSYLKYLHDHGEKRVFGQMVTFESRRGFAYLIFASVVMSASRPNTERPPSDAD